jgi:hypothetical protein
MSTPIMAEVRIGVILLLLAAAPAALASVQAAQGVQAQQSSQVFGIPPLPVILGAAGAALKQINAPITLNTRVVQDPAPVQQQQQQQVYYGQAAAADDSSQQYVSSLDQTAQPATGSQATGSGYWIQNADGSRTPLSDNDPILLQVSTARLACAVAGSSSTWGFALGPLSSGSLWVQLRLTSQAWVDAALLVVLTPRGAPVPTCVICCAAPKPLSSCHWPGRVWLCCGRHSGHQQSTSSQAAAGLLDCQQLPEPDRHARVSSRRHHL